MTSSYTVTIPTTDPSMLHTLSGSSSSFCKKVLSLFRDTLACTILEIRRGSIEIGNLRRLKSDSATKALSAVRLSSLVATNVPNVARDTFRSNKDC